MADWENVGQIQGPKGDKGDKGDTGVKGEKGDMPKYDAGTINIDDYHNNITLKKNNITFNQTFNTPPVVVVTPHYKSGNIDMNLFNHAYVQQVTTTKFDLFVKMSLGKNIEEGDSLQFNWIAIESQ